MIPVEFMEVEAIQEYADYLEKRGIQNKQIIPRFLEYRKLNGFNPERIIEVCAKVFGLSVGEVLSHDKHRPLPDCRFVIYIILHHKMTTSQIGRKLVRNHSTIIKGVEKFVDLYETNRDFKKLARECLTDLGYRLEAVTIKNKETLKVVK